jgi:hypothetical protein
MTVACFKTPAQVSPREIQKDHENLGQLMALPTFKGSACSCCPGAFLGDCGWRQFCLLR